MKNKKLALKRYQWTSQKKVGNQIEEYIWKWYPALIGAASIEGENKKPFIT